MLYITLALNILLFVSVFLLLLCCCCTCIATAIMLLLHLCCCYPCVAVALVLLLHLYYSIKFSVQWFRLLFWSIIKYILCFGSGMKVLLDLTWSCWSFYMCKCIRLLTNKGLHCYFCVFIMLCSWQWIWRWRMLAMDLKVKNVGNGFEGEDD
jgi:hypothetical protein